MFAWCAFEKRQIEAFGNSEVVFVLSLQSKEAVPRFELHDTYNGIVMDMTQSDLLYEFQFGDIGQKIAAWS